MEIIPNFIEDKEVQEKIKNTLIGNTGIDYYYVGGTGHSNDDSDFYFVHFLFQNKDIDRNTFPTQENESSPFFDRVLSPIIGRLKFNSLMRAKINLYTRKSEFIQTGMHVDAGTPHMVGLYSVNTNNGYTLFKDGTKVESIENQMVIFDGLREHCSVAQTDTNVRVNININFQ
tara:strand:- start:57 stop:575 length:519 start_codon:yes stop_codon:yes gene_type:complete